MAVTVLLLVHTNKLICNYIMINVIYQKLLKPGNYLILCFSRLTTFKFLNKLHRFINLLVICNGMYMYIYICFLVIF